MYRTIEDFISDLKNESEATLKVFNNIPENTGLDKQNDNIRSILRLSLHISQTIGEMMHKIGLDIYAVDENMELPNSISIIKELYKKTTDDLLLKVSSWKNDKLEEEHNMYGENWKNAVTFSVLIRHEIHHRGQLTTLMRLAGLKVPGIYGPAKEEWAAYGMVTPE